MPRREAYDPNQDFPVYVVRPPEKAQPIAELELLPSDTPADYEQRMMRDVYREPRQQAGIEAYGSVLPIAAVGLAVIASRSPHLPSRIAEFYIPESLEAAHRKFHEEQGKEKSGFYMTVNLRLQPGVVPRVIYSLNRLSLTLDRSPLTGPEVGSPSATTKRLTFSERVARTLGKLYELSERGFRYQRVTSERERLAQMSEYITREIKKASDSGSRTGEISLGDYEHLTQLIEAYVFPDMGIARQFAQNLHLSTRRYYDLASLDSLDS